MQIQAKPFDCAQDKPRLLFGSCFTEEHRPRRGLSPLLSTGVTSRGTRGSCSLNPNLAMLPRVKEHHQDASATGQRAIYSGTGKHC